MMNESCNGKSYIIQILWTKWFVCSHKILELGGRGRQGALPGIPPHFSPFSIPDTFTGLVQTHFTCEFITICRWVTGLQKWNINKFMNNPPSHTYKIDAQRVHLEIVFTSWILPTISDGDILSHTPENKQTTDEQTLYIFPCTHPM